MVGFREKLADISVCILILSSFSVSIGMEK
jgi:hypothetical protein